MIISSHKIVFFTLALLLTVARAQTESPSEPPENTLGRHLPAGVTTRLDLPYVSGGHVRQRLDLYLPGDKNEPHPLVVFVHGGAWLMGSKADCPQSLGGLLRKGYAVASLSYRLSQDARFPAQLKDCKAALRWLRAHAADYRFDAKRIGVMGPSAGGHLVALLGATGETRDFDVGENLQFSSTVQAVVDDYGPTDFTQMQSHAAPDSPEARLIGGAIQDPANRAAVQRTNPVAYLNSKAPPFLIFHGGADPTVPHHQSELLYAALIEARVPVRFVTIRGGGHGERFPVAAIASLVETFFDHHLKNAPTPFDWPPDMRSELMATPGS